MTNSSQVIIITGASSGIGEALAIVLAQQFQTNLVLAARNQAKLEAIAEKCRSLGSQVLVVPTDMTQQAQVEALARGTVEAFGRVDVVVNNAGYGQMGPIELIPPETAKHQFAVNYHGPLILIQQLIPIMRRQGSGKIINISSLGGRIAFPTGGLYSSSKFALEALSDVLRMELQAFGIAVSVVEPGPVATEFFDVAWQKVKENITDISNNPYSPVFDNIEQLRDQTEMLGWEPQRVAKVVVRAVKAKRPRPRYVAATGGKTLMFIMSILPTWIKDQFWKRFYGINKVEQQWRAQLPKA